MYKLMVVDDEQIVIEAVKFIVEKEIPNVELIHTARSGREAIEKARIQRPDIVLMDIRMPGVNGLEAVQEIKKIHKNIKFVIVSAYEYFEFAKQAVELEVKDYLLKPVNKARLIEVINRLTLELDEERKKQDQEIETREKIEKMLSVVGHGFIYSIMLLQKADIGKYKELFEMRSDSGYIFILTFKAKGSANNIVSLGESVQNQKFYSYFVDSIRYKFKAIIGPAVIDRVVVYVSKRESDRYEHRVSAISILEEILKKLENMFELEFKIGIGGVYKDENIIASYQEALKALNYLDNQKITHIDDISASLYNSDYTFSTDIQELILAIEKGDARNCLKIITDIFNKYENIFEDEGLKSRLIEVLAVAHRIAIENNLKDKSIEYSKYINQILSCKDTEEFKQLCIEKITNIASRIKDNKKHSISAVIDRANKVIDERFASELTLEDISKELCISPQYFSRLYKDEMGVNFIEQLTTVRIQNAKCLLKQGEHSIKEICYMSGYSDPNYFSRLFKKYEGVSPSSYLKQL